MTDEELQAIRERAEKATPGPWYTVEQPWLGRNDNTWVIAGTPDPHGAKYICDCFDDFRDSDFDGAQSDIDMDFIANARTDIPKLLDELNVYKRALELLSAYTREPSTNMAECLNEAREEIAKEQAE